MNKEIILAELTYKAVRSSGAGGQNVNKVSSKVILTFHLENSNAFSEEEKELIVSKLTKKLTQEGVLILTCEEDRSQLKNKEIATI
jgi:ribosome-associated protein